MESIERVAEAEVGPALGMKFRDAVRAHAEEHRELWGWDAVASLDNSQLAEVIGSARTLGQALERAAEHAHSTQLERMQAQFL